MTLMNLSSTLTSLTNDGSRNDNQTAKLLLLLLLISLKSYYFVVVVVFVVVGIETKEGMIQT